jgi:23S rRNA (pseudouridine1915-N3)-methyltransferase
MAYKQLIEEYVKRVAHYQKFSWHTLILKSRQKEPLKILNEEGELILSNVPATADLILLDEKGKQYTSAKFAGFLQKRMNAAPREIIFCIGGAFGFSDALYARANAKVALSSMTFTHQMVRLVFMEQLYRAFTILKGEKYHH